MTAASVQPLTAHSAWKALEAHQRQVQAVHLRALFAQDPRRGERFAEAAGLYVEKSRHRRDAPPGARSPKRRTAS